MTSCRLVDTKIASGADGAIAAVDFVAVRDDVRYKSLAAVAVRIVR